MRPLYYLETTTARHVDAAVRDCPYCAGALALGSDLYEWSSYRLHLDYRLSQICGWWAVYDFIENDGYVAGPDEYEDDVQSSLKHFPPEASIEKACLISSNVLAKDSERIHDLSSREFEVILGSVFKETLDCEVELTKQTRDGGADLIGFDSERGKFFVEAKRYARSRKIGVSIVRELVGAMVDGNVHRGLLVTTSSFSRDAVAMKDRLNARGMLEIGFADFEDVAQWLKLGYERYFDWERVRSAVASHVRSSAYVWIPDVSLDGFPKPGASGRR